MSDRMSPYQLVEQESSSTHPQQSNRSRKLPKQIFVTLMVALTLVLGALYAPLLWESVGINAEPALAPARIQEAQSLPVDPALIKNQEALANLYDAVAPSVVSIQVTSRAQAINIPGFSLPQDEAPLQQGQGSGFIYDTEGHIVTNNHVVEFADQFEVTLYDNRTFSAQLIGTDPKTDLAVLRIEASGLPTLQMADSDKAQVGEWVMAVGNPFDLNSTVTAGIISARGRDINIIKTADAMEAFIQTDAAVNPGNSGGALVNIDGELLGINTAIATRTGYYTGYSFAIPSNMVRRIAEDIISYGYYQRGKMGLSVVELDGGLAQELGLPVSQGLVVEQLEEGGAAEMAGLKPFDVIVEVNGYPVKSAPELLEHTGQVKPGEVVQMNVLREGNYRRMSVRMR